MSVYRVIDIIGTSTTSWEDAATTAIKTAKGSVRGLRVAEVVEQDLDLGDGDEITFRVKLQVSFKYEGDKLASVTVKSVEPVGVSLDEFEIHPRDGAGKLVKTVTEAIASNLKGKISNVAPVEFEFTAHAK